MATCQFALLESLRSAVIWLSGLISSDTARSMVAWAVGFLTALYAEPLRHAIFRPKLKLDFGHGLEFKTLTPEQASYVDVVHVQSNHAAEYVRIKVRNSKRAIAKNCRAYLVAIEKRDENGDFRPTIYCDSIQLAWSCRSPEQRYDPVDVPYGVTQFVDLVSTRSQKNLTAVFRPELQVTPMRYIELFSQHGTFRFTIQVSGENVKPVFIRINFRWHGVWNEYAAELCQ